MHLHAIWHLSAGLATWLLIQELLCWRGNELGMRVGVGWVGPRQLGLWSACPAWLALPYVTHQHAGIPPGTRTTAVRDTTAASPAVVDPAAAPVVKPRRGASPSPPPDGKARRRGKPVIAARVGAGVSPGRDESPPGSPAPERRRRGRRTNPGDSS